MSLCITLLSSTLLLFLVFFAKLCQFREIGDTFWAKTLGSWILLTADADNVQAILSDPLSWVVGPSRRTRFLGLLGQESIFSENGAAWHNSRRHLRKTVSKDHVSDLSLLRGHVETFLNRIPGDGKPFDMQSCLRRFAAAVAAEFVFGSTDEAEDEQFASNSAYYLRNFVSASRLGKLATTLILRNIETAGDSCKKYLLNRVKTVAKSVPDSSPAGARSALSYIQQFCESQAYQAGQAGALLGAGIDTTASTLSCVFWVLARHPQVMRELKLELSWLEGREPAFEDLNRLSLLNNLVEEVLRLWAPVPIITRQAAKDIVLPTGGGPDRTSPIFVSKGTDCFISSFTLHRQAKWFGPDAEAFNPRRWEAKSQYVASACPIHESKAPRPNARPSRPRLSFGSGPRNCLGQQLAMTKILYLLARFLQRFDSLQAEDSFELERIPSLVFTLKHGCWVSVSSV
ncbi:hypothetical protein PWT90_04704 [Aphanocladium album]|nr:hypothetical protein PWT90_04704 [Aphanocladium album]